MGERDTPEELDSVAKLGDVISDGESKKGGYDAYNSGTLHKKVLHSGVKDLSKLTVNQILASSHNLTADNKERIFAAGKYQIVTTTLESAKAKLPLTGEELFTPELQERIFLHFLLGKDKRPAIGAYITRGAGSVEGAVYAAAMEWASIEVPAGMHIDKKSGGGPSNGRMSYYESTANHAKPGSGAKVKAALEHARATFAGVQSGQTPIEQPEPLAPGGGVTDESRTADNEPTSTKPEAGASTGVKAGGAETGGTVTATVTELTPIRPGHIIANSVGKGGHNHEADVGTVQKALAAHGHSPGAIDHHIGPHTIAAIESFQQGFLPHADGLVEVGHATEQHLIEPAGSRPTAKQPTAPTKPAKQPATEQPTQRQEAPQPESTVADNATLRELMGKPHLTPEEIHTARGLIAAEPASARAALYRELQAKVIYANQRDNQAKDKSGKQIETGHGEMCNLTALAMCLEYLGIPNPHPEMQYEDALEKVRQDRHLPGRTLREGWGGVAKAMGAKVEILAEAASHKRGFWTTVVGGALAGGHSVMLSITGHIVRVQSVTEQGVVVDDPYGRHTLLAGAGKKVAQANRKDASGNAGEDNLWTWDQVEPHSFLWIAAFGK